MLHGGPGAQVTLQIFGDSNDSESGTGFLAGARADRRGHGRLWSRHNVRRCGVAGRPRVEQEATAPSVC